MIRFDDFKLISPRPLARLIGNAVDDSPSPYRIVRPAIDESVMGLRRWLQNHPESGWRQCDDDVRVATARRLLFVSWLRARGGLTDDR